jgi:predicted O-methyltransferase YrrM
MALKNAIDSLRMRIFPPSNEPWIAKSHAYGARLSKAGSPYANQWRPLDQLSYAPFDGEIINDSHRRIADAPMGCGGNPNLIELGVPGYLQRADALKLYELAYNSTGDVLELGTNKGLSTSIIAQALHDRGDGRLETVELDPSNTADAKKNLASLHGFDRVTFTSSDATRRMDELLAAGGSYGFIFIDHWHGYQATHDAATRAASMLLPGGFVMFHDFLDPGNADRRHVYGVYQAVLDTLADNPAIEFAGASGCCAIFRRKAA